MALSYFSIDEESSIEKNTHCKVAELNVKFFIEQKKLQIIFAFSCFESQ